MDARSGFEDDLIKDEVSGGSTDALRCALALADAGGRDLGRALPRRTRRRVPLPRARRGRTQSRRRSTSSRSSRSSKIATPSAGRSCSARADVRCRAYRTARRTRLLAWAARRFGTSLVLPMMLAEEGREVQAYLGLARQSRHRRTHAAALEIASDSAVHARELAEAMGRDGEPWHVGGSGGYLRSVVYGFNDGLTANFGLVAGVLGADVAPHIVIISGVAGAIADALSMGSSGYLAAKSEAEVQAHQIEIERHEMRLMPDLEEEELAIIYEVEGPDAGARAGNGAGDDAGSAEGARRDGAGGAEHPSRGARAAQGRRRHRHGDRDRRVHPDRAVLRARPRASGLGVARAQHAGALRDRRRAQPLHRPQRLGSGRDMFVVGFGVAAIGYFDRRADHARCCDRRRPRYGVVVLRSVCT